MVVGDYNAAASPEDRGTGKLLPYDTVPDALTVVLTRLSLIDVHRHKFPQSKHYTWSSSMGQKSRIDAVYANDTVLDKAGGIRNVMSAIGKTPGPLGTDHSPIFTRFSSPIATPNDGRLPTVFSPPPAEPSRWRLDGTEAQAYHDLLLRWPRDGFLSELSIGRRTFVQARMDLYPLTQAASVLTQSHP